jgi:uncharacterized protein (UPF0335 family)
MTNTTEVATEALRSLVERIERLEGEKKNLSEDLKDVYSQAKVQGFDVTILRKIIAMRKMEDNERKEQEAIVDLYASALGMSRGIE